MLVKEKIGHIDDVETAGRSVDKLMLEWHETTKRIMHKHTEAGKPVTLKFLKENQLLAPGDIIFMDEQQIIAVDVLPCEVLVIKTGGVYETACICYEIGNKHLPLFFSNGSLLVPYDKPLLKLLSSAGYNVQEGFEKLINPLKTSVSPHGHSGSGKSLLSFILNRTTEADE